MLIRNAISPFAQRRLNEALGLAVGLRPIGAGEDVLEVQLSARRGEALGAESRPVVGEHAANGDAERREISHAGAQKRDRRELALVGLHLGETNARVVIDRHEQELPAGASHGVARVTGHAMAHAQDTAQLLGIDVQQIAWLFMLVTYARLT